MKSERPFFTVTEITRRIKETLETGFPVLAVQGELSNVKLHSSGHLYFTLKDESAQVSGVMWRSKTAYLKIKPEEGMKVVVSGRISVYEARGVYQLDASTMRTLGIGELQEAFEKLKQKLSSEGLFDVENKKPLPIFPERIGLITSETGAALQDILNVFRRRFPGVEAILRPVRVQGTGAPEEISEAIKDFNEYGKVDLIILARGGGSIEDLWAFNEEILARAIFRSKIPTVSAIGHEIDFTIADFVADLRAPTPSAAAELVVQDRRVILEILRKNWYTMHESINQVLVSQRQHIVHLLKSYSFNKPIDLLRQLNQRVDELGREMKTSVEHTFQMRKSNATAFQHRLNALDPQLTLKRGYTIVRRNGVIIPSVFLLKQNDTIDLQFHDGVVSSKVNR